MILKPLYWPMIVMSRLPRIVVPGTYRNSCVSYHVTVMQGTTGRGHEADADARRQTNGPSSLSPAQDEIALL